MIENLAPASRPSTPFLAGWIVGSIIAFVGLGVIALMVADAIFGDRREREVTLAFQMVIWGIGALLATRTTSSWLVGSPNQLSALQVISVGAGLIAAVGTTYALVGAGRQGGFLDVDTLGPAAFLPAAILAVTSAAYAVYVCPPKAGRAWAGVTALLSVVPLVLLAINLVAPPPFIAPWLAVLLILGCAPVVMAGYYALRTLTRPAGNSLNVA